MRNKSSNVLLMTDEELMIRLAKKSDHEALSELYKRYNKRLLAFLMKLLQGDQDRAQDFLQDIFIKVYEKRESFKTDKKFYSWLFTIASNKCKNWYRDHKTVSMGWDTDWMNGLVERQQEIEAKELKKILREAIHSLEYHHKVVFLLRHIEGFPLVDIAEMTESSVGTVKSRLFYATRKLAEKLKHLESMGIQKH